MDAAKKRAKKNADAATAARASQLQNMFNQQQAGARAGMEEMNEAFAEGPGVSLHQHEDCGLGLKPRKAKPAADDETWKLFELYFADDTNLVTRRSKHEALEKILESTLLKWGIEVHPGKYERVIANSGKGGLPGVSPSQLGSSVPGFVETASMRRTLLSGWQGEGNFGLSWRRSCSDWRSQTLTREGS